jgi:predicted RNA binding protein YcfA (HicA-like mRNA interferase family)
MISEAILDGVIDLELRIVTRNDELLSLPIYRAVVENTPANSFVLVEYAELLLPLNEVLNFEALELAINTWLHRPEIITRGTVFTVREVLKKLKRLGFREKSIEGSHAHFVSAERKGKVTVPVHGGEIRKGTLKSILNQAGIDMYVFEMA